MADQRIILMCSCDDTMPLDAQASQRGCRDAGIVTGHQFCRAELERFRRVAASGAPVTMGCTQEAPLFREIIDELRQASATSSRMRLGEDVIATTVCRHAVKARDVLREPEMVRLIQDLLRCAKPPHRG